MNKLGLGRLVAESVVLILVCFAVYQYSVPRSFNTVYENRRFFDSDGEFIARQFNAGSTFTHNDHLLYHVVARTLHNHPHALGLGTNPVRIHMFLSSLFGALAVGLAYAAAFRLTGERLRSCAVALLCAVSAGWWFFSSTIDTYMPCMFFCLLSLALALGTFTHQSPLAHAGLGAAMGLAFLFRTDSFLLLPLGLVYLFPPNRRWRHVMACALTGLVVAAGGYALLAHSFYGVPFEAIPAWAVGGMGRPEATVEQSWGQWANLTPANMALALVNQLFYTVLLPGLSDTRNVLFWHTYQASTWATFAFVFASLSILFCRFTLAAWRAGNKTQVQTRIVWGMVLLWVAARTLFYCWWDPFDPFLFAVMSLPVLWVAALCGSSAIALDEKSQRGRHGVAIWLFLVSAAVCFHNVAGMILPLRQLVATQ